MRISFLMPLRMSGITTAVDRGIDAGYRATWLRSFAIAWPVAFPLVLAPRVRALVARLVAPPQDGS